MEPWGLLPCSQESSTGDVLSQIDPVHNQRYSFRKIRSNIIFHIKIDLPSVLLSRDFPTKIWYSFLMCMRATPSAQLIFMIMLIIFERTLYGYIKVQLTYILSSRRNLRLEYILMEQRHPGNQKKMHWESSCVQTVYNKQFSVILVRLWFCYRYSYVLSLTLRS